jgi:hypothetical protein
VVDRNARAQRVGGPPVEDRPPGKKQEKYGSRLLCRRKKGATTEKERNRMSRAIEVKWAIVLVAAMMAAIVVLSGPVAGVLDLPEPTAEAKKKKKKKKKKRPPVVAPAPAPEFKLVECAQQGLVCKGTDGKDRLVGTSAEENIQGGEGDDIYDGKNGEDLWFDRSVTSTDTYLAGPALQASAQSGKFEPWTVLDNGGSDILDFGPFSSNDIVAVTEPFEGQLGIRILLQEDPRRTGFVSVLDHLRNEENKVERFKFADRTLTVQEMEDRLEQI